MFVGIARARAARDYLRGVDRLVVGADGSRTVGVRADVSAAVPGLPKFAYSVLGLGIAMLVGSALLVALTLRRAASPDGTAPVRSPDTA